MAISFHLIFPGQSATIHAIIRNVNNSGERYTRLQLYLTHGAKHANEEHLQILELCRKRDVAAASKLLRQHILYAGESLKQTLALKRTSAQLDSGNGKQHQKA